MEVSSLIGEFSPWFARVKCTSVSRFRDIRTVLQADEIGLWASRLAYYAFFSVFPLLLLLGGIVSIIFASNPHLLEHFQETASVNFPFASSFLKSGTKRAGILATLGGGIAAIYGSLKVIVVAEKAFHQIWYGINAPKLGFIAARIRGFKILVLVGTLFLASNGVALVIGLNTSSPSLAVDIPSYLVTYLIDFAMFQLFYTLLSPHGLVGRSHLIGAGLAGLIWFGLQTVGGFLLKVLVSHAQNTYGSLAFVVGILTWLSISSYVVLLGVEVNKACQGSTLINT